MRLAILSDIHANHPALLSVIDDLAGQYVDKTYCLGDLVGYGPHPNQVIDTIRNIGYPTIMGNYDEGSGFEKGECGCAYITDEGRPNG
jgi:predicted phosphodiesterase